MVEEAASRQTKEDEQISQGTTSLDLLEIDDEKASKLLACLAIADEAEMCSIERTRRRQVTEALLQVFVQIVWKVLQYSAPSSEVQRECSLLV